MTDVCINFDETVLLKINPVYNPQAASLINQYMLMYEINTAKRLAAFISMCGLESANFRRVRENLKYSPSRALQVFPNKIKSLSQAQQVCQSEKALANCVYGGRYGNTATDDGYNYRGGGWIQTTFKDNYALVERLTKIPLVAHPELIEKPENACISAMALWKAKGCNELADALVFRFGQSSLSQNHGLVAIGKKNYPTDAVNLRKKINSAALGIEDFCFNLEAGFKVLEPMFNA